MLPGGGGTGLLALSESLMLSAWLECFRAPAFLPLSLGACSPVSLGSGQPVDGSQERHSLGLAGRCWAEKRLRGAERKAGDLEKQGEIPFSKQHNVCPGTMAFPQPDYASQRLCCVKKERRKERSWAERERRAVRPQSMPSFVLPDI